MHVREFCQFGLVLFVVVLLDVWSVLIVCCVVYVVCSVLVLFVFCSVLVCV